MHQGRASRPLADLWRAVTPRAVVGFTAFTPSERQAMERAGIQVLGTVLEQDDELPGSFSVAQSEMGRLQVRHLTGAGHDMIGYAAPTDPRVADFHVRRLTGARQECEERGLPAPLVRTVDLEVAAGAEAVRAWRAGGRPVTAVAAYNDDVAMAVLAGARSLGLRVPDDLAVIGVDDIPTARLAVPALTTVSQSLSDLAHYLGSVVLAELDHTRDLPPTPADLLKVVVRDSA